MLSDCSATDCNSFGDCLVCMGWIVLTYLQIGFLMKYYKKGLLFKIRACVKYEEKMGIFSAIIAKSRPLRIIRSPKRTEIWKLLIYESRIC